jgi:hypothetical protein
MYHLQRAAHQRPLRQQHAPCYTTAATITASDVSDTCRVERQQATSVSSGWWLDVLKQTRSTADALPDKRTVEQQQQQQAINSSSNNTASDSAGNADWWTDVLKQTTSTTKAISTANSTEALHSSQDADDTQLCIRRNVAAAADTSTPWWEQLVT